MQAVYASWKVAWSMSGICAMVVPKDMAEAESIVQALKITSAARRAYLNADARPNDNLLPLISHELAPNLHYDNAPVDVANSG